MRLLVSSAALVMLACLCYYWHVDSSGFYNRRHEGPPPAKGQVFIMPTAETGGI